MPRNMDLKPALAILATISSLREMVTQSHCTTKIEVPITLFNDGVAQAHHPIGIQHQVVVGDKDPARLCNCNRCRRCLPGCASRGTA